MNNANRINGTHSTQQSQAPSAAAAATASMDDQLNQVFSLLVSRSQGTTTTTDDDVENAVSKLLANTTTRAPEEASVVATASAAPVEAADEVEQDTDDYDNLDGNEEGVPATTTKTTKIDDDNNDNARNAAFPQATLESMKRDFQQEDDEQEDPLDQVPLGKAGAKMMVTFGDGSQPKPAAVRNALLGARLCLQLAIKDARALRRAQKEEYLKARKVAILSSKQGKLRKGEKLQHDTPAADTNMLYRAMEGWDKLAYDPKCGFDVEQLRQLFPEEMRAFSRWKEMHSAYKESSEEGGVGTTATEASTKEGEGESSTAKVATDIPVTDGHLEERAAQFDVRTDQMNDDWYLKFSEVRRGSFLSRKSGMKNAEERRWDQKRKNGGTWRGRPKGGNWESMSASSVRFLHWVGFDPLTALPPPNDETTEALAFLAYDFMGRIVEKAIYLRNVANGKGDKSQLLELREGEQLEATDIEKAINESTIRPVPLYSSVDNDLSRPAAAQLYFGPGFEDRLEMEMEELAAGKKRKRLSQEELQIRQREDELFAKLAEAPPVFDGFADVLSEGAAATRCGPKQPHEDGGTLSGNATASGAAAV